jgi:ADP-ribosylglycohydrolase
MLTGALIGAQTGIDGIPERFIEGLSDGKALLSKVQALAALAPEVA